MFYCIHNIMLRTILMGMLYEYWLQIHESEDDEEVEREAVEASKILAWYENQTKKAYEWEKVGERLFQLAYQPYLCCDLTVDRHVFAERSIGYFHPYQGVRSDAGSFLFDETIDSQLMELVNRSQLIAWLSEQFHDSQDKVSEVCRGLDLWRKIYNPDTLVLPSMPRMCED